MHSKECERGQKSVGGRRDDDGDKEDRDAGKQTSPAPAVCERNEDGFWASSPAVKQDGGQRGTLCQTTEGGERQRERKQNEASGCASHRAARAGEGKWEMDRERESKRELRVLSEQCRISLEKATPEGGSCAFVRLWEGRPPRALALVSRTCGCLSGKSYFKSILDEESKPV